VETVSNDQVAGLLEALRKFVRERDWGQFHTPENLAKSISIEAAELLECFQWGQPEDTAAIGHELADVLTYCILLADRLGLDPHAIVLEKLEITRAKYPVELSRGRTTKHDQL
jgi:NTP pyrophosphatase (non-canonical NTP hydrolase)